MKKLLFFFCAIALLASCGYKFDRYPGKAQGFISENLWGEYQFKEGKIFPLFGKKINADSIRIRVTDNGIYGPDGKKWERVFALSKSSVFSIVSEGKYYALSGLDTSVGSYWNTIIIVKQGEEIILYPLLETSTDFRKEPIIKYLPLKMRVIGKDNKATVTDVTEDNIEVAKRIAYNDNDTAVYFEMNDEKIIQYIEKELRPNRGMKFINTNTKKTK